MSDFKFSGDVKAINQQVGDNNRMYVSRQRVPVDWSVLGKNLEQLLKKSDDDTYEMIRECYGLCLKKDKVGIQNLVKNHFIQFSKSVLENLTASALIEFIKILL